MIDVKELRIGNLVQPKSQDFGDKPKVINQIHLLHNNKYMVYFKNYPVGCYINDIDPIPLDEVSLDSNRAFTKHSGVIWRISELAFIIKNPKGLLFLNYINNDMKYYKEIKYINQLQNLYYELTNTELNLNP